MTPGTDVWVSIAGADFPGEVLKVEKSGFVMCKIHPDPLWDFGMATPRIDPEQTVAVRSKHVRERHGQDSVSDSSACGGEQARSGS